MVVVYTAFNRPRAVCAPCGAPTQCKHVVKYDEFGRKYLAEDGVRCIYDEIQSFRQETDIKTILAKLANGDSSVLMKKPGFYGDVSSMPTNIHEVAGLGVKMQNLFDSLPDEVKTNYGDVKKLVEEVFVKGDIDTFKILFKPVESTEQEEGVVNAE